MSVTLRDKPIGGGRRSLYLDFYPPIPHPQTGGATRREFLRLYLYAKPATGLERTHNRETRQLAEAIRAERQLDVQAQQYGFLLPKPAAAPAPDPDFLAFFAAQADAELARTSVSSGNTWRCVCRHLRAYVEATYKRADLPVSLLTEAFGLGFQTYLATAPDLRYKKNPRPIAHNSALHYFVIFGTALARARKAKLLGHDPLVDIDRSKPLTPHREHLSLAELRALAQAGCEEPNLKRAGLFSALTGLRYSDVAKLTWAEVFEGAEGAYIRFRQQKTSSAETMPLSAAARAQLGERGPDAARVFHLLAYSNWQNQKLRRWAQAAGISRRIKFHAFRHTFAMLQIAVGTDLYTIAELLGHKDLASTKIYAKIGNVQKRAAVDKIVIDL